MGEEFHTELDKLKNNIEADLIKSLTEHESVEEALSIEENRIKRSKLQKVYEKIIELEEQEGSSQKWELFFWGFERWVIRGSNLTRIGLCYFYIVLY